VATASKPDPSPASSQAEPEFLSHADWIERAKASLGRVEKGKHAAEEDSK